MSSAGTSTAMSGTVERPKGSATGFGVLTTSALVKTGLIAAAFVLLFYRWFDTQNRHSLAAIEDWGHVYFIPVISLYLLWQHREELRRARVRAYWAGLAPFLLGIMCYFIFSVGAMGNHMFQGFSIILTLFGLVLLLTGPEVMRVAFVPIAFLVFGVTISEKIMIELTFPLQLLASKGAWIMLSLSGAVLGFSAEVNGNTLTVISASGDSFPLNVAEACSGMRMVIAFVALSAAVALIACRYWWQRVALLLLSVPVALLMNILRVAVLGGLTLVNKNLSVGNVHTAIGTLLLVPALGLFLAVVWSLNRVVTDPGDGGASA